MRWTILLIFLPYMILAQTAALQPNGGPGGKQYSHKSARVGQFGNDITDWYWVFEPAEPKPDSAEIVFFFHGHTDNEDSTEIVNGMYLFCEHLAKKGYVVVFPLYQYGGESPLSPAIQGESIKY